MPIRLESKRNILIAVAGHTPAIITETLWALEQQYGVRVDEIRVITTAQGRDSIVRQLLGENGQFAKFCADYEIATGRIAFSEKSIHVITERNGQELQDIRDSDDNLAAADQIFALIQDWTKREDESLFCSVAGGRKTLGIYLAMSLMLCGRPDDKLSHVLVSPEFEAEVPDFFYPPPKPHFFQRLVGVDPSGNHIYEPISSEDAGVDLADSGTGY